MILFARKKARPSRLRSYVMIELLSILLLLGVFMLVSGELFVVTMRTERKASERTDLIDRLDVMVSRLRRDVWSAAAIDLDGGRLQLSSHDKQLIVWQSTPQGTITRTIGGSTLSWQGLPRLRFDAKGPLVTLYLKGADGDESASFVSQQLLLNVGGAK